MNVPETPDESEPALAKCAHLWDGAWFRQQFGSGVAKALVFRIEVTAGAGQYEELDYERLAEETEFTVDEIRQAVVHLVVHGFARIEHNFWYTEGDALLLLTPSRLAAEAKAAEKAAKKARAAAERRAAKIALRGGQVNRKAIPADVRAFVFQRDGHACVRCGATDDLTLDHVHPWSIGGPDTADNLQTLCRPCNSSKGDRT